MYPAKQNRVRAKWDEGEVAIGSLTLIPEPSLPELVGAAGLDFMIADMEHAAAGGREIENMIRAAQAVDMAGLVRVRHVEEKTLLWVLDSGADGIMIPLIDSPDTARRAYELTRYPPRGRRTLCSATRAAGHGAFRDDFASFVESANASLVLVGLIETQHACECASEIAAEGIDVFCVGRADLSIQMGLGYAPADPSVIEITKKVLTQVMEAGKTAGVLAYDIDEAKRWIDFGCGFVIYSQPELLLSAAYKRASTELRTYARGRAPQREKVPV